MTGSVYDPRAAKINDYCKVDVNRFPELEYTSPELKQHRADDRRILTRSRAMQPLGASAGHIGFSGGGHGLSSSIDDNCSMGVTQRKQSSISKDRVGAKEASATTFSDERVAQLAWAIAHPARVQLIRILLARTVCVCGELVDAMPLSQSTVSQHLKILKEAGLIQGEIDGPKVCYCVNKQGLTELKKLIAEL